MTLRKTVSALLCAALAFTASASLLVVDSDGLGTDYATITAAIGDAEKGDTIIITKKHEGDWHEDLTIEKGLTLITQDLTIKNYGTITINTADTVIIDSLTNLGNISYTDGAGGGALLISDLILTGTVSYTAKGENGLMQISNSSLSGALSTGTAVKGGNVVRVLSTTGNDVTTGVNYELELYNSKVSQVSYADGDVIGNNVVAIKIFSDGTDKKSKIVGNSISGSNGTSNSITNGSSNKDIDILNNYFTASTSTRTVYTTANKQYVSTYSSATYKVYYYNGATSVLEATRTVNTTRYSTYVSDTTYTSGAKNTIAIASGDYAGVARIEHNFFKNYCESGVYTTLADGGKVLFNHNSFDSPSTSKFYGYMLKATGGFVTANYNFGDNASNYSLTGVTDQKGNNKNDLVYVDKGNPDPFYNDIDGTRADVGYEGGAYPYSTFSRSGRIADATLRKPLVMWVDAPRKIRPGQTIEIKATGIAF